MLNRRRFFQSLFAPAFASTAAPQPENKKFYITFTSPHECMPPIVSYGRDRLQAMANSGVTVWTQEEWEAPDMREIVADHEARCAARKVAK